MDRTEHAQNLETPNIVRPATPPTVRAEPGLTTPKTIDHPPKSGRPHSFWVIIVIAIAALGYAAWDWRTTWEGWLGPRAAITALLVSGNIEAHESVVGFKTVQSRIVELPFDEGQWVKAGTVIARLEDADYRQQVIIAETAVESQRRQRATAEQNLVATQKTIVSDEADVNMRKLDYDRYQALWQDRFASTQQRDQVATALHQSQANLERDQALEVAASRNIDLAEANIKSAEASLAMAKIVLDYTTLVAPFDGVVLVRQAELGEIAVPGTPVVTIADLDHVWLRAYINETDIGRVRLNSAATVTTDTFPGKKYQGRVTFISSSAEFTPKTVETHAERVTLVYRVKIDIDNPTHELVPGMPADASIGVSPP
jgi:HlyD family secretion protein